MKSLPNFYNRVACLALTLAAVANTLVASTLPASFDPDSYTALGELNLVNGAAIAVDTDSGSMSGSVSYVSTVTISDSEGHQYRAFVFEDVAIDDGVNIAISGSLGVAILSQDDLSLASDVTRLGVDAVDAVTEGADGDAGGDGGSIALIASDYLEVSSTLTVTGGVGGRGGPAGESKDAGNGGDGGDAGDLVFAAPRMQLTGAFIARGGEEGDVGQSVEEPFNLAGQGGDGGDILVCNDFTNTLNAELSEGSNDSNFQSTEGEDGSVVYTSPPSFLLPSVWYVDADREGELSQDGLAWSTAFADLQDALASATEGDQVWVAAGVYYPDEAEAGVATVTNDATNSVFEVGFGIYLLGGFDGAESEVGARDPSINVTILSGDIDHETNPDSSVEHVILDAPETNIVGDNADTVVYGLRYVDGEMRLDGFTITAGDSSGFAGGFYGAGHIEGCTIQGNFGNNVGGVLPVDGSLLTVVDSSVNGNSGLYVGGVYGYAPQLKMLRCRIQGNRTTSPDGADAGAARFIAGDVEFIDCLITGNYAGGTGGISFPVGNSEGESSFILNGCTVVGNYAFNDFLVDDTAGGIDARSNNRVNLAITNSVIWGNGGEINDNLYGYTSLSNSLVEGLNPGGTNLDGTDTANRPDFIDTILTSEAPTQNGDFRVYGNSVTVNAGDDASLGGIYDLNGRDRSIGISVDMGAFEYDGPLAERSTASFTLEIDETIASGFRRVFITRLFNYYDSLEVEYTVADVVSDTPDGSNYYRFTGIGEGGESTEVSIFAIDSVTGDRARVAFTVTLQDTYTVEDYRAENGMDSNGADDGEDFSGNGISNLMQFVVGYSDASQVALASADFDTEQVGLPKYEFDVNADQLTITWVVPTSEGSVGIYSRLRESTTLSSWTSVSLFGEGSPAVRTVNTASGYTISEVTLPIDQSKNFYQLTAEYDRSSAE